MTSYLDMRPVCGRPFPFSSGQFQACFTREMRRVLAGYFERRTAALQQGGTMCGRAEVAPHQMCVYAAARFVSEYTPAQLGGSRGLVVWHSTGSGKTLTSLLIMLAFWTSQHRIVFATTRANLQNNDPRTYATNLTRFFPAEAARMFPGLVGVDEIAKAGFSFNSGSKKGVGGGGSRRVVEIYSFIELANMLGLTGDYAKYDRRLRDVAPKDGRYTVFILDEAQNIATPAGSADKTACEKLKAFFEKRTDVCVFALTATPGSNVREWVDVLSLVRTRPRPFAVADAANPLNFAGLVSFADITRDLSKYGAMHVQEVTEPLDLKYFAAYLNTYPERGAEYDPTKPAEFFKKMRRAGTFLTEADVRAFLGPKDVEYFRSRGLFVALASKKLVVSTKTQRAVSAAQFMPGKQFVYTGFEDGAAAFARMLQDRGFERVDWRRVEAREPTVATAFRGVKKPRFVLYEARARSAAGKSEELAKYRALMNSDDNLHGEYIKIIVASKSFYEGINITGLRGVHLLEPLHSALADMQAVGRGLRQCGHATLPAADRNVVIFRYFATPPSHFKTLMSRFVAKKPGPGFISEKLWRNLLENYEHLAERARGATDHDFRTANRLIYQTTREDAEFVALTSFEKALRNVAIDAGVFATNLHAPLGVQPVTYDA